MRYHYQNPKGVQIGADITETKKSGITDPITNTMPLWH